MKKFLMLVDRISNFFFRKKFTPFLISILFFIIFGIAFYLIYLDSEAIKEQINDDFNQQQLILARQSSAQFELFLNNLEIQLKSLKWFAEDTEGKIRKVAMVSVLKQNADMGIIDIGLLNSQGKLVEYYNRDNFPNLDLSIIQSDFSNNQSVRMTLSPLSIYQDTTGKIFIISNITIPLITNSRLTGVLFTRLDLSKLFTKLIGNVRSGKTGYAWVIDGNAIALYHPESGFIGRNIFEARRGKKPYVNFSQINIIMKDKMMKGGEGTGIYESWWHKDLKGKITKLIAFTPIKNKALDGRVWSIAVVAPISEVAEAIDKAYMRHLGAELFIAIGMILFAFFFAAYQRKISESLKERVTEQQEIISSILENSLDAIIFTDKDNLVRVWNKGAEKGFEFTSDEMIGHSFRRLIPSEIDADEELNQINELVIKNGYISNYIAERVTKSDKKVMVNISKTLISSLKGEILGYSIIVRDETKKRELEHMMYNTEKLASIGTLAAGVAHEINNPLAIILGFTDLLVDNFPPDSQTYKDLKTIESNVNHAKKIVENLLGFARITEGLEDNTDAKTCIETVSTIVKNTLFTSKINLNINIPENLPNIRGDSREFQQVIFNLINNSVSAMKKTGGGLININAYESEKNVNIEISDTGEGIPNRIKQKIFDPFFTTKKVGEGTGLGLSLCYGIVAKFGGKIDFRSFSAEDYPGTQTGTTFIISIPKIEIE